MEGTKGFPETNSVGGGQPLQKRGLSNALALTQPKPVIFCFQPWHCIIPTRNRLARVTNRDLTFDPGIDWNLSPGPP